MKNTLIVCATNRPMAVRTRDGIEDLHARGAQYLEQRGFTDIALARNLALTRAVQTTAEILLLVDDDIVFDASAAQAIIRAVERDGVPTGAVYVMPDGYIAAIPDSKNFKRWLSGLGFLALRRSQLVELMRFCTRFRLREQQEVVEFTWSGVEIETRQQHSIAQWLSEDFRLCRRLGGVRLLPIAVGHVKERILMPDSETLDRVERFEVESEESNGQE